jgi:hypothetical protein
VCLGRGDLGHELSRAIALLLATKIWVKLVRCRRGKWRQDRPVVRLVSNAALVREQGA